MGIRLNLGCGIQHKAGWTNVDRLESCRPDVLHDLRVSPWPFDDSSVTEAIADNLIEHIGWGPDGEDLLMVFMNECHRVIAPGGRLWLRVPSFEHWPVGALRDPTHRRYFVSGSFDYWDADHQTFRNYGSTYGYQPWNLKRELFKNGQNTFFDVTQTPVK